MDSVKVFDHLFKPKVKNTLEYTLLSFDKLCIILYNSQEQNKYEYNNGLS